MVTYNRNYRIPARDGDNWNPAESTGIPQGWKVVLRGSHGMKIKVRTSMGLGKLITMGI